MRTENIKKAATTTTENTPVKLHLGCGTNKLPGWINIDSVAGCQPDRVLDLMRPLPFADQSVEEILAEDLLEHFDKYMRFVVFGEWARVLRIGGRITVQVPNFKKILFRYFKFGFDNFVDFIFGENMWRSDIYIGHFGNHKWGYSEDSLKAFVSKFGVETLSLERKGLNLRLCGEKRRHIPIEEIDNLEIYSHANATGNGVPKLPLGFVRKRISQFQKNINSEGAQFPAPSAQSKNNITS